MLSLDRYMVDKVDLKIIDKDEGNISPYVISRLIPSYRDIVAREDMQGWHISML